MNYANVIVMNIEIKKNNEIIKSYVVHECPRSIKFVVLKPHLFSV